MNTRVVGRQLGATVLLLAGCGSGTGATSETPPDVVTEVRVMVDSATARRLLAADRQFHTRFPGEAPRLAVAGTPPPGERLIGRNRQWGAMYASRFQMGTGTAHRLLLAAGARAEAQRAFDGIEAGFSTMEASGRLPARVPASVSMGQSMSDADVASGAAFFLGDACTALLALAVHPDGGSLIAASRQAEVQEKAVRSAAWLHTQAPLLLAADAAAPNRLLFDARALLACTALAPDDVLRRSAELFVQRALQLQSPEGWFVEGGSWDTNYQAVALEIGADVHAVMPNGATRNALAAALVRGAAWLTARVDAQGRVDSRGNRRTCSGGESFLGTPKSLSLPSVVTGLGRVTASVGDVPGAAGAVQRVYQWAVANPERDPCHEGGV
jgi:hypothetical protein